MKTNETTTLKPGDRVRFSKSILDRVESIDRNIGAMTVEEVKADRGTVERLQGESIVIRWDGRVGLGFAKDEDLDLVAGE